MLSLALAASLLSGCVSSRPGEDTSGDGTGDTSGEVQEANVEAPPVEADTEVSADAADAGIWPTE